MASAIFKASLPETTLSLVDKYFTLIIDVTLKLYQSFLAILILSNYIYHNFSKSFHKKTEEATTNRISKTISSIKIKTQAKNLKTNDLFRFSLQAIT